MNYAGWRSVPMPYWACGDIEKGEAVVYCDMCGRIKGASRPHGFVAPMKDEAPAPFSLRRFVRDALLRRWRR